jgi:hypothetical protein
MLQLLLGPHELLFGSLVRLVYLRLELLLLVLLQTG